ncbi:acetate--CoA ligase family protein [Gelria sp. Kuro-4]|uniref:acetate--CoA ligase family protein n=1 Tax=Gelria sp. Kuro-4 TaxID=2796927 RepID=UPI001BEE83A6|nr:acetate--CoA ligase family protein [Gelria sp. Kuro-4]BCV25244.1 acetyl-CoA synthetase [Gelria sp. Kuro-4]
MDLGSLLRPKTVAVVGATEKPGFGANACKNLLDSNLGERLYFVNPRRTEVMGKKCFASISAIPEPVDLVVICTPRDTVNAILEEAAAHDCRAAVVYASGYREMGGDGVRAEQELQEVAQKHGIALCGPNCGGFVNNVDQVWAFGLPFYGLSRQSGSIGLIAQSGQICLQLMNVSYMGYSYVISSGNNTIIDAVDYLDFLIEDEQTKVIALYLEGVREPNRFAQALAKAARCRKPVVVLKTGVSDKGRQIAAAHTGSLAGSDAAFNAVFKKFGVIRVNDVEQLLTTSLLFSKLKEPPKNPGLAILNLSGGETAISADLCHLNGIKLPDFAEDTKATLKEVLPEYATPNNPLDMTATVAYDSQAYRKTLRTIMADPSIGMLVLGVNVPETLTPQNQIIHTGVCDGVVNVTQDLGSKPIVVIPSLSGHRDPGLRQKYDAAGVPILPSPHYGFTALKQLTDFLNYNPDEVTLEVAAFSSGVAKSSGSLTTLSEHESKLLLQKYGVPVSHECIATNEKELVHAAATIGYPVVLKIDSPDTPHKTDIGGVKLNITNEDELLAGYKEIIASVKRHKPDARINGVLVQEMLAKGLEAIVGVSRDDQFGPMVLVGLGGVFVEVFKDVALYPVPLTKLEALRMIDSLRAAPLFKGYRGSELLDVDALAKVIVAVGRLAAERKHEIRELDLNPVFVYPKGKGVKVADALIVI